MGLWVMITYAPLKTWEPGDEANNHQVLVSIIYPLRMRAEASRVGKDRQHSLYSIRLNLIPAR